MKMIKITALFVSMMITLSTLSLAKSSAEDLNHDANMAINSFIDQVNGGDPFLVKAKAFLVFPEVNEGGMMIGGKYAEGVLRRKRDTLGYYEMMSASIGMQMGAQTYSMIIAFTTDEALDQFLAENDEWETEVNGKIVVADWNSKEKLDEAKFDGEMIAFVFDSKGLMGSFTMEGTKFKKIVK